jgi:hypothetical protein
MVEIGLLVRIVLAWFLLGSLSLQIFLGFFEFFEDIDLCWILLTPIGLSSNFDM